MSYPEDVSQKLTIAFDGDALRDGSIDVRVLAPSLLALGDLFEAANEALNGDRSKVAVRIRATGEGSFEINFDLIMSLAKQVQVFFSGPEVSGTLNLIAALGLTYKIGSVGVIQALKWLRGRKPEQVIENENGTVTFVIERETLVVQRDVVVVLESERARKAVVEFVEPLARDGIDTLDVRGDGKKIVLATKADLPALQAQFPEMEAEDVESTYRVALKVLSPSFQEQNKWKVSDGEGTFFASLDDDGFRSAIDENRATFGKGDVLVCELYRRQRSTAQGIKSEYSIKQVIEHRRAPRQLSLLPLKPPEGG